MFQEAKWWMVGMAALPMGTAADVGYWLIKRWVTHLTVHCIHCIKGLVVFPSLAGMSLTKLSLMGN
jgi:hypothetical protein